MKKAAISYTVKQLSKMIDNGTLSLESDIQRRGGVWIMGSLKSSLLIHSILGGFIIPPLYFVREDTGNINSKGGHEYKYSVIDGKQRLTVVTSFINDEWALNDDTPTAITEDGEEVELAGKTFSELDEEVRDNIRTFMFTCYYLDDFTDEEIEECFFRLNNGVTLTKGEQSKARIGIGVARFINEITGRKFFTEIAHFTQTQLRRAADQLTLMQTMLLLDVRDGDYELASISEGDILKYAEVMRGNYSQEKRDRITSIVDYLEDAITEKDKFLKKVNIPMIFIIADKAINMKISAKDFGDWFFEFSGNYTSDCEYAKFCGSGSIKKALTLKRIELMEKDFDNYFADNAEEESAEMSEEMSEETVGENADDEAADDYDLPTAI